MYKQKVSIIVAVLFCLIIMCNCGGNPRTSNTQELDSVQFLKNRVAELEKQIELLQYPADARLKSIKEDILRENFDKASAEINELRRCFPQSEEAKETNALMAEIQKKKEAIEAEKQRIKALGFKALNTVQDVTIGENKITFSNFKIGLKYTHDVYPTYSGSEWREHTADKGSSYISYNMDVTSTSKNPQIPTIAFYSVEGENLVHQITFWVNFARWSDYGCYLGNEPDLKNDFSKVNTVKFRVGAQLEDSYFKNPYVVVLKKSNTLSRKYERFENPPVSYIGDAGYPSTLNIDNFNKGQYVALKIANL